MALLLVAALGWLVRDRTHDEVTPHDAGERARGKDDAAREARLEGRVEEVPASGAAATATAADRASESAPLVVHAGLSRSSLKLPGVKVTVVDAAGRRHEGHTDVEGRVSWAGLAQGAARVECAEPGMLAEPVEVEVGNEPSEVRLYLRHAGAVGGRVLSATTGQPVPGAHVIAGTHTPAGLETAAEPGDALCIVTADREGRFHLTGVPSEEGFAVTVVARGYARELRRVHLQGVRQEAREILVHLHPGTELEGLVEDRRGRAVAGADVYVYPESDETLSADPRGGWSDGRRTMIALRARTGEDGRFLVVGLALDARYAATAFAPTHPRSEEVNGITTTTGRSPPPARLVLPDPATLEITVLDEEGGKLAGVQLLGAATEFELFWQDATHETDAQGGAVLSGLPAGRCLVRAEAEGFLLETQEVDLVEGKTERVEIRMRRGATVSGIVVDLDGRPLEGVQVRARYGAEEGASYTQTDEEGHFHIPDLPPGPVRLEAGGREHALPAIRTVEAPAEGVRLECTGATRVRGQLRLPTGTTPPEHVQIGVFEASGAGWSRVEPWDAGRFEVFPGSAPRILHIQGESFAPWRRPIHVEVGVTLELGDVVLSPGVTCMGTVVDAGGTPIPAAVVSAVGHEWRTVQTDAGGRFELTHLRAAHLSLSVEARGFMSRWARVPPDAAAVEQRIVLARGGLLRVRVLDGEGLVVLGASVAILRVDVERGDGEAARNVRVGWGETDDQGRIEKRMPPGRYRIEAELDDETRLTAETTLREGEATEVELRP